MTLDRRPLLLMYLLLVLLRLINTKTGQGGDFNIVDTFNAEKIKRRKLFVVESARRILPVFQYKCNC